MSRLAFRFTPFVFVLLAFAATHAPAHAQVLYGSLTGVVSDGAGAIIPNATVKARNVETSQEVTVQTNSVGSYTISSLAPGN